MGTLLWGRKPLLMGGRTKHRPASERTQLTPVPWEPKGPRQHLLSHHSGTGPVLLRHPKRCSGLPHAHRVCRFPSPVRAAGYHPPTGAHTARLTPLLCDKHQIKNKPSWARDVSFGWGLRAGLGPEQGNMPRWGLHRDGGLWVLPWPPLAFTVKQRFYSAKQLPVTSLEVKESQ